MTLEEYVNVRIPKSEYDKLKQAREYYSHQEDYSYVGYLALGAFIGFLIGLALSASKE